MNMLQLGMPEKLNMQTLTWGDLTWINIEKPTRKETEYLGQSYHFHPLDLDDCLSRIQRPKIDEYKDYLFIVLHFPAFNKQILVTEPSQVSVFISDKYLVTLHEGRLKPLVKLFVECQADIESREEYLKHGSAYLIYRIIDRLVDYCFPILNKVDENLDLIEEKIFANVKRTTVRDITEIRRDIISLRRILGPMRGTINGIEPKIRKYTVKDLAVYFGDTGDHLEKIWDMLEEDKEVIEGLNNAYDSLSSERVNNILRTLTILATIGAVLTFIVGFYGMNIPLPGGSNPGGYLYCWVILILAMAGVTGGMLLFFKRKGWL